MSDNPRLALESLEAIELANNPAEPNRYTHLERYVD